MTSDASCCDAPSGSRSRSRKPTTAPTPVAIPPSVGTTEFAISSRARDPTTMGSPADRPASMNRERPSEVRVNT